jgi:hypothetical protein
MSHVAKIEVEIKDLEALAAAAKRLGGELVKQSTYTWYGHSVGDYPLPEGFTAADLGRCEHAIRFPGAKYEVGVVKRRDGRPGYTLLWDFWQGGYGLTAAIGDKGQRISQAYGVEAATRAARRQGNSVTETQAADGSVVLKVRAS